MPPKHGFSDDFSASFPANAMEKALSNILSNAVKHTKSPGKVNAYFRGRAVIIENECEPIQASVLPHIFEPFYRPDGGNGLGLYITARILNTLSYRFSFEPFVGQGGEKHSGMRFTIFF